MMKRRRLRAGRPARLWALAGAVALAVLSGSWGAAAHATVTPAISTYCPTPLPTLSYGLQNNTCVAYLQGSLNGEYGFNLSVDGNFGTNTLWAVKALQTKAGISVDGQVGPQTWTALSTVQDIPIADGHCMVGLKLTPNFNNGGYGDWGAAAFLFSGTSSVTCEGFLTRDEGSGWTQVSDTHAVTGSSVTTYTYWDGVGARVKACIWEMQGNGLPGPMTCTNPF